MYHIVQTFSKYVDYNVKTIESSAMAAKGWPFWAAATVAASKEPEFAYQVSPVYNTGAIIISATKHVTVIYPKTNILNQKDILKSCKNFPCE